MQEGEHIFCKQLFFLLSRLCVKEGHLNFLKGLNTARVLGKQKKSIWPRICAVWVVGQELKTPWTGESSGLSSCEILPQGEGCPRSSQTAPQPPTPSRSLPSTEAQSPGIPEPGGPSPGSRIPRSRFLSPLQPPPPQDKMPLLSTPPPPSWRLVNSHQNKSFRVIGFHSTFILLKGTVWDSLIARGSH